jgi:hypothetical protein
LVSRDAIEEHQQGCEKVRISGLPVHILPMVRDLDHLDTGADCVML